MRRGVCTRRCHTRRRHTRYRHSRCPHGGHNGGHNGRASANFTRPAPTSLAAQPIVGQTSGANLTEDTIFQTIKAIFAIAE